MTHKVWTKNRIGRNIVVTYIRGFFYNAANSKTGFFLKLWGDYDLERATKLAIQKLGTSRLLVEAVEYDGFFCSMPLDTFVENCDVVIQNERFAFARTEKE